MIFLILNIIFLIAVIFLTFTVKPSPRPPPPPPPPPPAPMAPPPPPPAPVFFEEPSVPAPSPSPVASAPIKVETTLSGFYKFKNASGYLNANPDNTVTMGKDSDGSIWIITQIPKTGGYYSIQSYVKAKSKFKGNLSYLSPELNLQFINTDFSVNLSDKQSPWNIVMTDAGTYKIQSIHKAHNGGDFTYLSGATIVKDPDASWTVSHAV